MCSNQIANSTHLQKQTCVSYLIPKWQCHHCYQKCKECFQLSKTWHKSNERSTSIRQHTNTISPVWCKPTVSLKQLWTNLWDTDFIAYWEFFGVHSVTCTEPWLLRRQFRNGVRRAHGNILNLTYEYVYRAYEYKWRGRLWREFETVFEWAVVMFFSEFCPVWVHRFTQLKCLGRASSHLTLTDSDIF